MFDPFGDDAGNEWIELYNNGTETQNINGGIISNRTGEIAAILPNWDLPANSYLVVYFGTGSDDDDFSDGSGSFYTRTNVEIFNNAEDECALTNVEIFNNAEDECALQYNTAPSDVSIIDFVSWCFDGDYNPGQAHGYAVSAEIWDSGDYFYIYNFSIPTGKARDDVQEGDTIGRDRDSTDTDTPYDLMNRGGYDARGPTLGLQNIYPLILNVTISTTKSEHLSDITSSPDGFRGSTSDDLGICWFQSEDGEGAGQQITVNVSWESAKMKDWKYSACFKD